MKGNFRQILSRGWAEAKTGLWSSSDSLVMMWNSTFCKTIFPFVLVILLTVSCGQRRTFNCHSSFQKNIWPSSTLSRISIFYKSGSSTLTHAGALYVLSSQLFHTPKCPYGSHLYYMWVQFKLKLFFRYLEKWMDGKNPFFSYFVTQIKLLYLCSNLA